MIISSQPRYNKNRLLLSPSHDNIPLKYEFKNKCKLFLSQMTWTDDLVNILSSSQ